MKTDKPYPHVVEFQSEVPYIGLEFGLRHGETNRHLRLVCGCSAVPVLMTAVSGTRPWSTRKDGAGGDRVGPCVQGRAVVRGCPTGENRKAFLTRFPAGRKTAFDATDVAHSAVWLCNKAGVTFKWLVEYTWSCTPCHRPPTCLADRRSNRRLLLGLLSEGEKPVQELVGHFDITFAAVSQHLGVLREAGLVVSRPHGRNGCIALTRDRCGVEHWTGNTADF